MRSIFVHATAVALLFLALPSIAAATCEEIDPVDVLPADEACPTWMRDGDAQTAYTDQELFELINGGATLFITYGFVAAAIQNYTGESAGEPTWATVSIYNQGTAENAEALYNDPDSGYGDNVEDWGWSGAARTRVTFQMALFEFWHECFFGSVVVGAGGEAGIPEARCLAEEVCAGIQSAVPAKRVTWGSIKADFTAE